MNNNDAKILTMLGFAEKSRKLVSGDQGATLTCKKGQARLAILATDLAEGSRVKLLKELQNGKAPVRTVFWGTKEMIGDAIGKSPRGIVAIKDQQMANTIVKLISEGEKKE